jgi:hypothetical protein
MIRKITNEVRLPDHAPVGVGFPAIVIDGVTKSAANVDPGWVDFDADAALERVLKRPVHLVNDADAAGVAEMRFGIGQGERGTVFLITLGTGTGSALFYNGVLVPNLELGHMEIRGRDAERRASAGASAGRPGRPTSTSTCWPSSGCSARGCSSSAGASPSAPTSSSRGSRSAPAWCRRGCATTPASWAPRWRPPRRSPRRTADAGRYARARRAVNASVEPEVIRFSPARIARSSGGFAS